MKTLTIPIHSFVDLITNSSSEVYISATKKSAASLKEIIDSILKAAGSDTIAEDIFKIENVDEIYIYGYGMISSLSLEKKQGIMDDYNVDTIEDLVDDGSAQRVTCLKVTAHDPANKHAAELLSSLSDLFTDVTVGNG